MKWRHLETEWTDQTELEEAEEETEGLLYSSKHEL